MLVAAMRDSPIPNGLATFDPPDRDSRHAGNPDYPGAVGRFLSAHDLEHLCRLNLSTSSWQVAPRLPMPIIPLDTDVALGADDPPGSIVYRSGWDPQESNGLVPKVAPATPLRIP